ncbi:MAG TPA: protocatechuate 3,4-dioxygenase subunit alpha [Acidimicrobiales bacterium]|jgi:protocatechuate 3,4-dioxygenase alpha subunit
MSLATPSQTVGPFFAFGMSWLETTSLVDADDPDALVIRGTVLNANDVGVPDAVIETFQADEAGRFGSGDRGWTGFCRILSSEQGDFAFTTIKPGATVSDDGTRQAPHIDVSVFARGLLQRVITRIYFPDEEAANNEDPVLSAVEENRRTTLIAQSTDDHLRFDVHLQGEAETVFFNC